MLVAPPIERHLLKIEKLQKECEKLKDDITSLIPSIAGNGESLILNGTSNARFKKFIVSGNSKQDGEPSLENRAEIRPVGEDGNISVKIENNKEPRQEQNTSMHVKKPLLKGDYLADDGIHYTYEKIVLDGTKNYGIFTNAPNQKETIHFALTYKNPNAVNNDIYTICENLKSDTSNNVFNKDAEAIGQSVTYIVFRINKNRAETVEQLKEYLAKNPIAVYVKREKEIIEPYTPEQQKAYDLIKNTLHSYKDITYISSDDEVSPIFDVEALVDVQTEINRLQKEIDEIKSKNEN